MESATDLAHSMRRARLAYELGRARRALIGFLPALLLVGVACVLGDNVVWSAGLGLGLFVLGATLLWYGRDLKRAVLPGVFAGSVPLLFVLCSRHFGHACTGISCTTLCMQACAAGGIVAGLAVARVGNARKSGAGYWLAASALALLTGAMACACLGVSGIVGLALGYGAGLVPGLMQQLFATRAD